MYINIKLNHLNKLPLIFQANLGQTLNEIKFLAKSKGFNLFLSSEEVAIIFSETKNSGDKESTEKQINYLNLKFINTNNDTKMIGVDELPGKINYLIGDDPNKWHKNIPTYKKVKYVDVYP